MCEHERKYYVNVQTNGRVEADSVFCADCGETLYDRKKEGAKLSEARKQTFKEIVDEIRNNVPPGPHHCVVEELESGASRIGCVPNNLSEEQKQELRDNHAISNDPPRRLGEIEKEIKRWGKLVPNNFVNQPEERQQELQEQIDTANIKPPGRYEMRGREIGANTDLKNEKYGDAFRKIAGIIKIMYPNGVGLDRMGDFTLVVRALDKLCRIADGDKKAFDENPWRDLVGYGLLGMDEI